MYLKKIAAIGLALVINIMGQQGPIKLVPKTVPAKPIQLKPVTQPARPQMGKSALITPTISAKTSKTQVQTPLAQPTPTPTAKPLLIPKRVPAPAQKPAPIKTEAPPTPKEPFDLKKVIAERKALSKSKGLPTVKSDYYTPENLQKLKSQGIPYHLPCMVLIDQDNTECPTCDNVAITARLAAGLLDNQAIICSASIVHNLFYRLKYPAGEWANEFKADKFDMSLWHVYDVLDSQFILFVPNKYKDFFNEELRVNDSNKLSNVTDIFLNFISKDIYWMVDKKNSSTKFSVNDLKNIFISKKSRKNSTIPIWDFIIVGHGSYDFKMIAGLHHEPVNKLLSFFDNEINTGVIALESCYAGGKNLELLQVSQSGINLSHNYILIVCSSTDQITYGFGTLSDTTKYYNEFFSNAAQLADKGESLNKIIRDLQYVSFGKTGGAHGETSRIPQIWLPNGLGFQTLNINNDILPIGKVLIKTHEDEKKPITINQKRAVLIYSNLIPASLVVEPAYIKPSSEKYETARNFFSIEQAKELQWKNIPMATEYAFWQGLTTDQTMLIAKKLQNEVPKDLMVSIYFNSVKGLYIFPQFLFMRGITVAHFKKIDIKNPDFCPACGVLHFIRDAFFAERDNPITKIIYIDSLTGYNDLALTLKARNLKNEALGKPSSENEELIKNLNQIITLKNIRIIMAQGNLYVNFELYEKPWRFSADSAGWNITPNSDSLEYYRDNYEHLKNQDIILEKLNQKSISEVLKLKQQEILKNKTPAKKVYAPRRRKILMACQK